MGWGSGIAVSCGVGHRGGSDPTWLWRRLAAVASIRPLAWELPCAKGGARKKAKKEKVILLVPKAIINANYYKKNPLDIKKCIKIRK